MTPGQEFRRSGSAEAHAGLPGAPSRDGTVSVSSFFAAGKKGDNRMKILSLFFAGFMGIMAFAASAGDFDALSQTGAVYEAEAKGKYQSYEVFTADNGEPQVGIYFAPKEPLRNFRVLSLTFRDADDNGAVYFDEKEIYRAAELNNAKPLLVRLTFIGSIPNYGISFEDAAGNVRKFTISESGMDGSLYLFPF